MAEQIDVIQPTSSTVVEVVDSGSPINVDVVVPSSNPVITIGIPGMQGPPGAIAVGTVATGAAGSNAVVAVRTLGDGSQVVDFTIPSGATGPANTLTIGTVSTGAAAATITGTAPNQTLNLTIPANTLAIGTVATGAPGSSASATITGTAPNQTLNLSIPQGPTGAGAPDATTTAKGSIQLAGDLAGTAAAPTVPGLAGKANTTHTHVATDISNSTATGQSLITAIDAAAARTAIGAGTSNLTIGTTGTTAKAGDYSPPADAAAAVASMRTLGTGATQAAAGNDSRLSDARTPLAHTHPAANISDSTVTGRSLITAVDAPAARTAIGAGTSSLVIGTAAGTAAAGNDSRLSDSRTPLAHAASHATGGTDAITPAVIGAAAATHTHTAANISDSTTVGRSVLTAVDAPTARTALGAGTSSLVIGTTAGTAAAGNDSRLSDARTPTAHTHTAANISDSTVIGRTVLTALDAPAVRTAIGAGTSSLVIGTTNTTAKAGDYAPPAATTGVQGLVQLTNHLGGTATAPTVRAATDTQTGIVELATPAEVVAGVDSTRSVTPAGLSVVTTDIVNPNKTLRVIPKVEGMMLSGFGHSYLDPTFRANNIGPAQRYFDRVASRLSLVRDNNATQGYHMQDVVVDAMGRRDLTKAWTPGERGIAIIDAVTNDAGTWGDTATALNGWEQGFRSLIWFLSSDAASVKDDRDATFTYSANWTDLANGDYYGGTLKQLANSASGTITFTLATAGKYALTFASLTDASREHELLMDGAIVKTFIISGGQACAHVGPLGARSYSAYVATFDVPAGSHTFVLRNKAGSTAAGGTLFDSLLRLNTVDPVQIFVPRAVPWPGGPAASVVTSYNTRMTTVAAEFTNVILVDTLTGFNASTHIGADAVHLNAVGNEFYADRMVSSIVTWASA